eukprot:357886-Chlamydomonas_euryale.AAC.10
MQMPPAPKPKWRAACRMLRVLRWRAAAVARARATHSKTKARAPAWRVSTPSPRRVRLPVNPSASSAAFPAVRAYARAAGAAEAPRRTCDCRAAAGAARAARFLGGARFSGMRPRADGDSRRKP